MAGSFFVTDLRGQKTIVNALKQILRQGSELAPVFSDIGEFLIETHQQRFIDMQAPDGTPWEPLAPETLAKKQRPDRILTETGILADTLNYQISNNQLLFGTNMEYGATHQFGRDEIPERPWLGLAPFERKEILLILRDHLED
jgi:phage virion morphogenesis protein